MKLLAKAVAAALTAWACSAAFAVADPARQGSDASTLAVQASADARYAERWIRNERDNGGQPFAIVDKKAAHIYVFDAGGTLVGESATLLGTARGDVPVPGSASKQPSQLLPNERRTPAGRFTSEPGRNIHGESVVWVDYESGIAIHRVRPGVAQAQRLASLSDALPDDKRLSLGCVVVPEAFFTDVVLPTLGHSAGKVYVLPEEAPVQALLHPPVDAAPRDPAAPRAVAVSAVARK